MRYLRFVLLIFLEVYFMERLIQLVATTSIQLSR